VAGDQPQVAGMCALPTGGRYFPAAGVGRAFVGRAWVTGGQPDESLGETAVGAREQGV
jgi:hypothetical protein